MQLECNAVVPGSSCDFVAQGETAEEVAAAMLEHQRTHHAESDKKRPEDDVALGMEEMESHIFDLLRIR